MIEVAFLDVEASGLGEDSYPIEIGWALLDGTSGCVLVAPPAEWLSGEWDELAEELHHNSLEDLMTHGVSPWDAAEALNKAFGGMDVLSDAPEMDRFWIRRLFDATPLSCSFQIDDFGKAFEVTHSRPAPVAPEEARVHRAEADAAMLRDHWLQTNGEA